MKKYSLEIILLIIFAFIHYQLISNSLWFDELLTTPLIQGFDLIGIIKDLKFDYHPPFYFLLIKIYSYLVGDTILDLKFFNVLISLVLGVTIYLFSQKIVNQKFARITGLLYFIFPCIYNEVYQIRMYMLAPLLLFLSGVYGYYFSLEPNRNRFFILFLFFSVLALYTHYFAFIGVILVHFISLIYLYYQKKKISFKIFKVPLFSYTLFIPWLPTFIYQINILNDSTWNSTDSIFKRLIKYFIYPFYTGNNLNQNLWINYISTTILILLFLFIVILFFKKWKNIGPQKIKILITIAFLIPIFILIIISLYTIICGPIWYPRYFIIFFPFLILGFSYMLYNQKIWIKTSFFIILTILFFQKIYFVSISTSDKGFETYFNLSNKIIQSKAIILDPNIFTMTYCKDARQYLMNEKKFLNYPSYHTWNIKLVDDYSTILKKNQSFWSTELTKDSIKIIGGKYYKAKEIYLIPLNYREKSQQLICKYEKLNSNK